MPKSNVRILIVDDDVDVRTSAELFLGLYFSHVEGIEHPSLIQRYLTQQQVDVVLLDMNYQKGANTGKEGMYWLRFIRELNSEVEVLLMTAYADIQLAVEGLKAGAADYITKPWNNQKLLTAIRTIQPLRAQRLYQQEESKKSKAKAVTRLVGSSSVMQQLVRTVKKVAATEANVLILGENGTGKQVAAELIHQLSHRNQENFVHVDLGSLSSQLFESELFGYEKGAFTDAKTDKAGRFEEAEKGSLFLDEIGNIDGALQSKLLSALQNRKYNRVGARKSHDWNGRLICATNLNLVEAVRNGSFRQDLLYRINTITIEMPPLRARGNDILELAQFFLEKYARQYQKMKVKLSDSAQELMLVYPWPGNVRELQHCIERAVILSDADQIFAEDLNLQSTKVSKSINEPLETLNLNEMEKKLILQSIEKNRGNISKAAKDLGITRTALYRRMEKYDL